jgi:predicted PurR-regulated permease PerM
MPWPFAYTPSSTGVSEAGIVEDGLLVLRAGLTTRLHHDDETQGASVTIPGASDPVVTGTPSAAPRGDLARTVLAVLLLGVLIVGSFWILRPFLLSLLWAITIVVATWPLMLMLQARVKRRAVAVAIMTGAMLLVFIVPVALAIDTLAEHTDTMTRWAQLLATSPIPVPPDWVLSIPLVGEKIAEAWSEIAAGGQQGLVAKVTPYATVAAQYLAFALSGIGLFVVQLLLTIVMAVILFVNGETARDALIQFGRRLAGGQGETVVLLAGQSIRAVALGVVVTALAQTMLAGLGLFVTGVPFAGLLTAMILILCIAQLGPIIVLVPAVIWLYWTDQPLWGSVLLVWTLVVGTMDNVLRPVLIRRGADLPLLLIFSGVIGGLIAFGIVGLFVGPVVLAIAYTLLQQWMNAADAPQA